jgi:hypothetical protein
MYNLLFSEYLIEFTQLNENFVVGVKAGDKYHAVIMSHCPLLEPRQQHRLSGTEGHCDLVTKCRETSVQSGRCTEQCTGDIHPAQSSRLSPNHNQQSQHHLRPGISSEAGDVGQQSPWPPVDCNAVRCGSGGDGWSEYWLSNTAGGADSDMQAEYLTSFRRCKKTPLHAAFQTRVYNFLERPTGWKCFIYHFSV